MIYYLERYGTGRINFLTGQSYLSPVSTKQVGIINVTFEPDCRNHWHVHHATAGGGQILICVGGRGYYQEWGQTGKRTSSGRCGEYTYWSRALAWRCTK